VVVVIRAGSEMGRAGGSVDASALAKFIVQAADLTLPNAQDLSALANGLLLNTAGVLTKATANTDYMAALAGSGIAKVTAGVPGLASAGVDFSKGPWKLTSTVRNGGAAQTISIPVTDGENNGIVRATGRIISDGTDRSLTLKFNGAATNVTMQYLTAQGAAMAAARTAVGSQGVYGCQFEIIAFTSSRGGTLKRFALVRIQNASATLADSLYTSAAHFKDIATTITTLDIDCGNATGMAAAEAQVEEGIVS
jgi:hypothetical protein